MQIGGRTAVPRTPNGIRTRAAAVKGRCPRPLDDGGQNARIGDHDLDDQGLDTGETEYSLEAGADSAQFPPPPVPRAAGAAVG